MYIYTLKFPFLNFISQNIQNNTKDIYRSSIVISDGLCTIFHMVVSKNCSNIVLGYIFASKDTLYIRQNFDFSDIKYFDVLRVSMASCGILKCIFSILNTQGLNSG